MNTKIRNISVRRFRPQRESLPFTFEHWFINIVQQDDKCFKLTSGLVKVSGWTRHTRDVDIDVVSMKVDDRWVDIKPQLEYTGGMKRIDEAAKNHIRRFYHNLNSV